MCHSPAGNWLRLHHAIYLCCYTFTCFCPQPGMPFRFSGSWLTSFSRLFWSTVSHKRPYEDPSMLRDFWCPCFVFSWLLCTSLDLPIPVCLHSQALSPLKAWAKYPTFFFWTRSLIESLANSTFPAGVQLNALLPLRDMHQVRHCPRTFVTTVRATQSVLDHCFCHWTALTCSWVL